MIKFVLENFDTIFRNEKSLESLNKIILDLAIRGKLVEQNPEDEPASELLKRIKEEKERLIKEKVIKKEKELPKIEEDEIPFEIPESWEWVRLGEIIQIINGYAYKSNEYVKKSKYQLIRLGNVKNDFLKLDSSEVYLDKEIIKKTELQKIKENDILVTLTGTRKKRDYFYTVRIDSKDLKERELYLNQRVGNLRCYKQMSSKFLNIVLKSTYLLNNIFLTETGTANQGNIGTEEVKKLLVCLPPIAEQKRIVEKVERLQGLIKNLKEVYLSNEESRVNLKKSLLVEIEKSNSDKELLKNLELVFSNFDKVIRSKEDIKDIRNLILSLAIKGKLVEQNPEDEPASELLKRIKEEKERLIKEKVIKKEKELPKIEKDEIPFEIPESWEKIRMADIGEYKKGPFGSALTKSLFVPKTKDTIKVYEQKNAIQKDWRLGEYYISKKYFEEKMRGFEVKAGDILVSCAGTIGETYIMPQEIEEGIINQALMRMRITNEINIKYFLLYFDYVLKKNSNEYSKGSAIKNIPPFDIFKRFVFLLPPLAEQQRIVERVEKLMSICDMLEEKIVESERVSEKLLESLVKYEG